MDATSEREVFRRKFAAAIARSPPMPWYEIWYLCLQDPWFKAEQVRQARFVLRSSHDQMEWLDDVCQETVVILSAKFENNPKLGSEVEGPENAILNYIRTTIRNASQQALRQLRRKQSPGTILSEEIDVWAAAARYQNNEQSRALDAAIRDLPEPLGTILRLHQTGYKLPEIAKSLGIKYWDAYRDLHQGLEQIRAELRLP